MGIIILGGKGLFKNNLLYNFSNILLCVSGGAYFIRKLFVCNDGDALKALPDATKIAA